MFKKILATTITVGLALSLSACAPSQDTEKQEVANTYETFVTSVLSIEKQEVETAYIESTEGIPDVSVASDEQKQAVIDRFISLAPDAYGQLDLSGKSLDDQGEAITGTAVIAASLSGGSATVAVPADAISIDGDKATIDKGKIVVNFTQGTSQITPPEYSEEELEELGDVELVKKKDKWLITSTSELLSEIVR